MLKKRFFYFCALLEIIALVALVCNAVSFSLNPFFSYKIHDFKSQKYFSYSQTFVLASKEVKYFQYNSIFNDIESKNCGNEPDSQDSHDENDYGNEEILFITDSFFVLNIFTTEYLDIRNYHPIDKPKLVLVPPPKHII